MRRVASLVLMVREAMAGLEVMPELLVTEVMVRMVISRRQMAGMVEMVEIPVRLVVAVWEELVAESLGFLERTEQME